MFEKNRGGQSFGGYSGAGERGKSDGDRASSQPTDAVPRQQGWAMVEVRSKAAVVRYVSLPLDVTLVQISGVASLGALAESHIQWRRQACGWPMAAVIDYSKALVALDERDLRRWLADDGAPTRGIPVAMVVSEQQAELFLRHAAEVAALGVNRQVFLDLEQALAWAERHAVRRLWTSSRDLRMAR